MSFTKCLEDAGVDAKTIKGIEARIQKKIDEGIEKGVDPESARRAIVESMKGENTFRKKQAQAQAIAESKLARQQMEYRSEGNRIDPIGFALSVLENPGNLRGNAIDVSSYMDVRHMEDAAPLHAILRKMERGLVHGHKSRVKNMTKVEHMNEVIRAMHGDADVSDVAKEHAAAIKKVIKNVERRAENAGLGVPVKWGDTAPWALDPAKVSSDPTLRAEDMNNIVSDIINAINDPQNSSRDLYKRLGTNTNMDDDELREYVTEAVKEQLEDAGGLLREKGRGTSIDAWSLPIRSLEWRSRVVAGKGMDDHMSMINMYVKRASEAASVAEILGPKSGRGRNFLMKRGKELHKELAGGAAHSTTDGINAATKLLNRVKRYSWARGSSTADEVRIRRISDQLLKLRAIGHDTPGVKTQLDDVSKAFEDLNLLAMEAKVKYKFDNWRNLGEFKDRGPKQKALAQKIADKLEEVEQKKRRAVEVFDAPDETARLHYEDLLDKQIKVIEDAIDQDLVKGRSAKDINMIEARSLHVEQLITGHRAANVNENIVALNKNIRNLATAGLLGGAVISSITDEATKRHAIHSMGLGKHIMSGDANNIFSMLGTASDQELAQLGYISNYLIETSVANARYLGDMDLNTWTGRAAERVLSVSGLTAWTESQKKLFFLETAGAIAKMHKQGWDEINPQFRRTLEMSGIDAKLWNKISQVEPELMDKGGFISIPKIRAEAGDEAANRLATMIRRWQRHAVLEPGHLERSWLTNPTGDLEAGSTMSEVFATITALKSHPLTAAVRTTTRLRQRAMMGEGTAAVAGMAGFVGGLTILGAVAMQVSEISKGYGPMDMFSEEHGEKFWWKALAKGGGLGLIGDAFMGATSKNKYGQSTVEALLGPSVDGFKGGAAVIAGLAQGDIDYAYKGAQKFSRYVPGASLWQTRAILNGMILKEAHRLYDPEGVAESEEKALKYRRDNYGSESLGEYMGF